jgi:hypothetical protein
MPFGTAATQAHKFTLGQDLVFMPGADFVIRVPTRCKVTRLLPKDGPEYQYHRPVRSTHHSARNAGVAAAIVTTRPAPVMS